MEDYPRTLQEFEARFSTEEGCREYLFRLRWPDGFRCPRCGGCKAWAVRATLFQCSGCDLGDGGHRVPGYAKASHHLVSGEVACDQPEKRRQRTRLTEGPGTGQLSDRLVVAAQIAARDGPTGSRSAHGLGGSG